LKKDVRLYVTCPNCDEKIRIIFNDVSVTNVDRSRISKKLKDLKNKDKDKGDD